MRIQSRKLTQFWGRPIYVHATVLLPRGYAERPDVRYPAIYTLGHGDAVRLQRHRLAPRCRAPRRAINPVTRRRDGLRLLQAWISRRVPAHGRDHLEQQTPYFPDSYSVNSANNGPYGDAIVKEVIPELERRFRLIPKPYARHIEGASTSGWQTLAMQLQHPDYFGGAWVLQPDPIDFRHYLLDQHLRRTRTPSSCRRDPSPPPSARSSARSRASRS